MAKNVTKVAGRRGRRPALSAGQVRAFKGWETRRANLLKQRRVRPDGTPTKAERLRRSEEKKLAWETRRQRQEQMAA